MAKTRRNYSGTSVSAITQAQMPSSSTTSFTVNAATNWPYGTEPFTIVIDPETASEEKLLVTRSNSTTDQLDIVQRGFDGTSAVLHAEGATTFPVFTALDADEANELTSMWESKGDIVSYGTATFGRVPVGADDTVLIADSGASSGLSWGQVDTAGIANDAITTDKIADDAVSYAQLLTDLQNRFPRGELTSIVVSVPSSDFGDKSRASYTVVHPGGGARMIMFWIAIDDQSQWAFKTTSGSTVIKTDISQNGNSTLAGYTRMYSLSATTTFEFWNINTGSFGSSGRSAIYDLGLYSP